MKTTRRYYAFACLAVTLTTSCAPIADDSAIAQANERSSMGGEIVKSEAEWKAELTPEQYRVTRQCGTERPGTGALLHNKEKGTYTCVACGHELFTSDTKYDSGSGWPSFWEPASDGAVGEKRDSSLGMVRVEVVCPKCDSHLGHVFTDGPQPTGLRYCINSVSLDFVPSDAAEDDEQKK